MIKFICLFFPALVCVGLYEALLKKDLSLKGRVYMYGLDTAVINGIVFGAKQYLLKTAGYPLADASGDMLPSAAFNYLIMGMLSSVCLAVLQVFLSKNAKVTIEETANEN